MQDVSPTLDSPDAAVSYYTVLSETRFPSSAIEIDFSPYCESGLVYRTMRHSLLLQSLANRASPLKLELQGYSHHVIDN
jgi:hypothetical protein